MITATRLRLLFNYDPVTGWVTRRVSRKGNAKGSRAGNLQPNGYRRICIDGVKYYEHRLVWLYVHGVWPPEDMDHRDAQFADNRLTELRQASTSQNLANARRRSDNTSGYKGVSLHKATGMWRARVFINKRETCLGYFRTTLEAHKAYVVAATAHYGQYARVT